MTKHLLDALRACRPLLPVLAVLLILGGCAGRQAHREGLAMLAEGKAEEALEKLKQATIADPDDLEFRIHFFNAREKIVARLLSDAERELAANQFDDAERFYRRVLTVDPNNSKAMSGSAGLVQIRRHARLVDEASGLLAANDVDNAEQKVTLILQENPQHPAARSLLRQIEEQSGRNQVFTPALRKTFQKPVSLEFRDASLKQVMEVLSRHSGLNFIIDKDVPSNLTVTTYLRQVSVEEALNVMLSTNALEKRVLNDNTLLIYPDTTAKHSQHQDLVVKTFYLANANAKEVMNMLKAVLKAKNVYVDEKLNLLIMRDTPTSIQLAERLVAAQDVSDPEVMLEVEVIEVQRSKLLNLGIQFPDQLTLTPLASGTSLTLQDLKNQNSSSTGAAISPVVINLKDQITDSNVLANPRIRTRNREKAEIKIGDRVPIVTTTSTATGFVSENVQYVDVGLKLTVEPTISPNDQISIKLGLEVSTVVKQVTTSNGTLAYQIGSRNATTTLRLADGETQILGGLISNNESTTANRFPGLGDLPILGRLFSSQKDNTDKTELVLSITPRLVRGLVPPLMAPNTFWSGTESSPRLRPLGIKTNSQDAALGKKAPPSTAKPAVPESGPTGPSAAPLPASQSAVMLGAVPASPASPQPMQATPAFPGSQQGARGETALMRWEGPTQAKVGSSFKLTLKVSSQQGIANLPLQIKYDPTTLAAVGISPGAFMTQRGAKADVSKRIVAETGIVFFAQNRAGLDGAKGDGDLLEMEFRALKPAQNSPITVLPTVPVGIGNLPQAQSAATTTGITVTP